jgi:hypothetical protein
LPRVSIANGIMSKPIPKATAVNAKGLPRAPIWLTKDPTPKLTPACCARFCGVLAGAEFRCLNRDRQVYPVPDNLSAYMQKRIESSRNMSENAFHEKAGRSQVGSSFFFCEDKFFLLAESATVAMLPFALSRSDSIRSVQFGRSRYSRCCHLFGALWFCSFRSRTWARR